MVENIAKLREYMGNGGSIRGLLDVAKERTMKDKAQLILDPKTMKKKNRTRRILQQYYYH